MADEPAQMSEEQIQLANQLFDLARAGETEQLAAYIDAGAPLEMHNANGDTFLILAAYNGAPETVAMLIGKGADLEAENNRGQRALTCAVFKQDVESATHLLNAGADPDAGTPSARATAQMFGFTGIDGFPTAQ
ncbi:ankyrin repeat domain-containing protein [Tessaracoccus rhinocerotis]|uniref:Ankyrin repeat domain-containing protein n=1 Tax=Tessaracoccus rhinocerotis TaxID=1689449 RepID=A0A553JXB9_9ACTN|nr:ankyrin repeat domain-containing protein [Tessaracoccus rhinocerotis]TRY17111.1 ankyrin repeat domain-containing protein [Tessaracoccus rhinocerotis]